MKKLLPALLLLITLAGCSSGPSQPAEKPQPKPPEALTGRAAFQKLYVTARGWARDAQPYQLDSQVVGDYKGQGGKAVLWSAGFASPTGRAVKPYTWSGIEAPDVPARGVDPGVEDTYVPTNASTQIFDLNFLKTDSDHAFDIAQKHGGEKLLAKSPDTPVFYSLDWNRSTNELTWHVIYGPNRDEAKLRVAVNASSGDFLRVEK